MGKNGKKWGKNGKKRKKRKKHTKIDFLIYYLILLYYFVIPSLFSTKFLSIYRKCLVIVK